MQRPDMSIAFVTVLLAACLMVCTDAGISVDTCTGVVCNEDCYTCKKLGQVAASITKIDKNVKKLINTKQPIKGDPGFTGPTGPVGPPGRRGRRGDEVVGVPGPQGAPGPQGPPGRMGEPGETGESGQTGASGLTGRRGTSGPAGQAGTKGDKGNQGPKGEIGLTGKPNMSCRDCISASARATRLRDKIEDLETRLDLLQVGLDKCLATTTPTVPATTEKPYTESGSGCRGSGGQIIDC